MARLGQMTSAKCAPFVLAPDPDEQKRIVDKLDAVLARVDACRERLDRVPDILKRFRQAVLAAATSGKLTEDWRETQELVRRVGVTVAPSMRSLRFQGGLTKDADKASRHR